MPHAAIDQRGIGAGDMQRGDRQAMAIGDGGGGQFNANTTAGTGGSGIVIIRYPNTYKAAASTTNATYSTTGTWIVYTFTQSGSITL